LAEVEAQEKNGVCERSSSSPQAYYPSVIAGISCVLSEDYSLFRKRHARTTQANKRSTLTRSTQGFLALGFPPPRLDEISNAAMLRCLRQLSENSLNSKPKLVFVKTAREKTETELTRA
jgi:hypothetical protein